MRKRVLLQKSINIYQKKFVPFRLFALSLQSIYYVNLI